MSRDKENLEMDVSSWATSETALNPMILQSFGEGSSLQITNWNLH